MTWSLVCEHLFIVLAASILSICIGLPLGILAYVYPKARAVILRSLREERRRLKAVKGG